MNSSLDISLWLLKMNLVSNNRVITGVSGRCPRFVILPNKTRGLDDLVFSGVTTIEELHINQDIEFVGRDVCANCPNLKKVYIYKGQERFINNLTHYNDAEVHYVNSDKE